MNSELRKRKPDGIHPTFVRVCFGMANVVTNLGGLQKKLCSLQNLEILEVLHIFFHQKITYTYFSTKKSHIIFLCTYFSTKNQISLDPPQKKGENPVGGGEAPFLPMCGDAMCGFQLEPWPRRQIAGGTMWLQFIMTSPPHKKSWMVGTS